MVGMRILDITVLSADDLKNARLLTKMNVYAIVSVSEEIQTTCVDKECGKKPVWNQRMRFNVDETVAIHNNLNVIISLKSNGGCFGGCIIGEVCIPVKDMLSQDNGVEERAMSYKITTPGGRTKGTLHIAYKFGPSTNHGMAYAPPPLTQNHPGSYPPAYSPGGYPPPHGGGYPPPEHAGSAYPPPGGSWYAPLPQDHYHHHHSHGNFPAYPPPEGYPPPNSAYPAPGGYPPPGQSKPYPAPPSLSGGCAPNAVFQAPTGGSNYPPPPPPGYDNGAMRSAAPGPGPGPAGYAGPPTPPGPGPAGFTAPQPVALPTPKRQNKRSVTKKIMTGLGLGVGAGVLGGVAAGGLAAAGGMELAGLDNDAAGIAFADSDNVVGGWELADSDMEEED